MTDKQSAVVDAPTSTTAKKEDYTGPAQSSPILPITHHIDKLINQAVRYYLTSIDNEPLASKHRVVIDALRAKRRQVAT